MKRQIAAPRRADKALPAPRKTTAVAKPKAGGDDDEWAEF
jgi:hypothetical protein